MIRIGIVGAGQWGPNLIRNFQDTPRSCVHWIADRDTARLAEVRARFPDVAVTDDPMRVFASDDIDGVVIATPTSTHYALAKAALEHDKHVLVEKPIATTSAHAEEITAIAHQRRRVLMVGHVFLYNAGIRKVKEYIDSGHLGCIYYVSMVRTNLGPIRADVNAAWDLAAHDLSIVDYWLGGEPLSVSAIGGTWINPGLADAVFATLRFPHNVLVNLHVSWLNPRKARDITVVGDKRMLTFDDMNLTEPLRVYDKSVTDARTPAPYIDTFASYRGAVREGDIVIPRVAAGEPLKAECDHFLSCIADSHPPLTDGAQGAAVVRVLEAIERSLRAGGREELLRT